MGAVVKAVSKDALKPPISWRFAWNDRETGGERDGSIWIPVAPPGYRALGCVAIYQPNGNGSPSGMENFMCVHESCCTPASISHYIWNDLNSRGYYDGSVWAIEGSPFFWAI